MSNKIKFIIKPDLFPDFILKLSDLTSIEDTIKLKIDKDDIIIYSMLGESIMLAFKNYTLKTKDYLEFKDDFDYTLDIVILNAKKFVKNLGFLKIENKITLEITYKESPNDENIMDGRSIQLVNGKLKINLLAGEHHVIKNINKDVLDQKLNLKNRKWSFSIIKSDFMDIKKLSNINGEKIININVVSGKVNLYESSSWDLEVDLIDTERNANLIFNKRFFSCIDDTQEKVEFNIFETFMLIKGIDSNLMLSFEQTFEDD